MEEYGANRGAVERWNAPEFRHALGFVMLYWRPDDPNRADQEDLMKKKGNRNIPDFSRKRPSTVPNADLKQPAPTRVAAPVTVVKPHSTSSKSGRRGQ